MTFAHLSDQAQYRLTRRRLLDRPTDEPDWRATINELTALAAAIESRVERAGLAPPV
jgi:hypothetical protein